MFNKTSFIDLSPEKILINYLDTIQGSAPCLVLKQLLPNILDGAILFDEHSHLIYMGSKAAAIMQKIAQNSQSLGDMPMEIACIKQFMLEAKKKFPHQAWLNKSTIFVDCITVFHVCACWIQSRDSGKKYLLLRMEDQNQFSQDLALEEAKRLGLTLREQEVWLLHRHSYTYKQIAEALEITPNTVKKHMKSILVKQRSVCSA